MLAKLVYTKTKLKDNRLIFDNKVKDNHFFPSISSSAPTMKNNDGITLSSVINNNDINPNDTLQFESRFESGNLLAAFKINSSTYELLLHNDTNTTGYNKWFFFKVNNMKENQKYTLNIINNPRQNKQYANGIKIFTYSLQKNNHRKIGWHHSGEDVSLFPNKIYQFSNHKRQNLFTLTFSYVCEYENDTIYFANCLPYTYSKLMNELDLYQSYQHSYYHHGTLCKSVGGNTLDYFCIDTDRNSLANNSSDSSDNGNGSVAVNYHKDKEGIVLFARQHPSETVGSWVIKGAMDLLIGDSDEARYLRNNFEILVIPMVNIDGVIAGNSRTSYAGCDLNRKWKQPSKHRHPEIYHVKERIRQFSNKRKIMCLVDFHGHLSDFNSFFYCNCNVKDINQPRAFPYACARNSSAINFDQCCFSMFKYKEGSSRINLYNELGIENACTLETSGFGFDKGKYSFKYINENILQEIGRDVCMGMITYHYYKTPRVENEIGINRNLLKKIQPALNDLVDGKMNINEEDYRDVNEFITEVDDGKNNNTRITNNTTQGVSQPNYAGENNKNKILLKDAESAEVTILPKLTFNKTKVVMNQPKTSLSTNNIHSLINLKHTMDIIKPIIPFNDKTELPPSTNNNPNTNPANTIKIMRTSSLHNMTFSYAQKKLNQTAAKPKLRFKALGNIKECNIESEKETVKDDKDNDTNSNHSTNGNGNIKENNNKVTHPLQYHSQSSINVLFPIKLRNSTTFNPQTMTTSISLSQSQSQAKLSPIKHKVTISTTNIIFSPNKRLVKTIDFSTQTEVIFFQIQPKFFAGTYKILSYKEHHGMKLTRNRFSILKSLTTKEKHLLSEKEDKGVQTQSQIFTNLAFLLALENSK